MRILKRWERVTLRIGGEPVRVRLKCLKYHESPDFMDELHKFGTRPPPKADGTPDQEAEVRAMRDQVRIAKDLFARYVKLDEQIHDEDGNGIDTAEQLFYEATQGEILGVLQKIQSLATLSEDQGKDSGSPSTSSSAAALEVKTDGTAVPA